MSDGEVRENNILNNLFRVMKFQYWFIIRENESKNRDEDLHSLTMALLLMKVTLICLFCFVEQNFAVIDRHLYDYDAYAGLRLAVSDKIIVLVQNDRFLISFAFPPYLSGDDVRQAEYPVTGSNIDFLFLYGVAVGQHQTSLQFVFYGHASVNDVPIIGLAEANTRNNYLL